MIVRELMDKLDFENTNCDTKEKEGTKYIMKLIIKTSLSYSTNSIRGR